MKMGTVFPAVLFSPCFFMAIVTVAVAFLLSLVVVCSLIVRWYEEM